jgi:hypothetical protein
MTPSVLLCLNLRREYVTAQCASSVSNIAACLDQARQAGVLVVHLHHLWSGANPVRSIPELAPRAQEPVFISTRLAELLPSHTHPITSVLMVGGVYTFSGLAAVSTARKLHIDAWLGADAVFAHAATPDALKDPQTLLDLCKPPLRNQTTPTQATSNIIPWRSRL